MRFLVLACLAVVAACGFAGGADSSDAGASDASFAPSDPWADAGSPLPALPSDAIYRADVLPRFEIELSEAALDALRAAPREYVAGNFIYGDQRLEQVGIRLRGHSSFRPVDAKAGFKIKFNAFVPRQHFLGLERLTLGNMAGDPSYIAERLSYEVFRAAGLFAPRANSAVVVVNGERYGVYANIEATDDHFLGRWFDDAGGNLYEAQFSDLGSQMRLCNDAEDTGCFDLETNEASSDGTDLAALAATLGTASSATLQADLADSLDWPQFLRYCATEGLVNQIDGYGFSSPERSPNNYRVYHDPASDRWLPIPWGMDHSIKPFPLDSDRQVFLLGSSAQILATCLHQDACRSAYKASVLSVLDIYEALDIPTRADQYRQQIADEVALDPRVDIQNGDFDHAVERLIDAARARPDLARQQLEEAL